MMKHVPKSAAEFESRVQVVHALPRDQSRELLFLKKWTYSRAHFYPIGVSQ